MYHHIKKLMYTVKVDTPDPRFGNMLLEQFGGANGELAAAMQYSIQGLNCEDPQRKDLLMDIGTEELSHLEVVGTLARMHLKPMKKQQNGTEVDPLIAIAGGGGVSLFNSMGDAWTGGLPEDHGRTGCGSAKQYSGRSAGKNRLRAVDQSLRRSRFERCIAVLDDTGNHAYEGVHAGAGEPGKETVLHRKNRANSGIGRRILQRFDRRGR